MATALHVRKKWPWCLFVLQTALSWGHPPLQPSLPPTCRSQIRTPVEAAWQPSLSWRCSCPDLRDTLTIREAIHTEHRILRRGQKEHCPRPRARSGFLVDSRSTTGGFTGSIDSRRLFSGPGISACLRNPQQSESSAPKRRRDSLAVGVGNRGGGVRSIPSALVLPQPHERSAQTPQLGGRRRVSHRRPT